MKNYGLHNEDQRAQLMLGIRMRQLRLSHVAIWPRRSHSTRVTPKVSGRESRMSLRQAPGFYFSFKGI